MTGRDKKLYYWDSCIFLYAVNRHAEAAILEGIDNFLKLHDSGDILLCTSALVHIEVSAERLKKLPKKYAFLRSFYDTIEMIQIDSRVVKLAAEIKDFYAGKGNTLSTPDVIHLASAVHYEADEFHTCDGSGVNAGRGKLLTLTNPIAGSYRLDIKVPKADQPGLFSKSGKGISQTSTKPN